MATTALLYSLCRNAGFSKSETVIAAAIAIAESGGKVGAIGGPNKNGTYDYGLWQINSVHGYDKNKLLTDPQYNANAAYAIYKQQGWKAWSVFNSGAYKSNLKDADFKMVSFDNDTDAKVKDTVSKAAVDSAVHTATGGIDAVGSFFNLMQEGTTWKHIGYVVGGGILVTLATIILAGEFVSKVPVSPVGIAAKALK